MFTLDSSSIGREISQIQGQRSSSASLYDEQAEQAQKQVTQTERPVIQAKQQLENTITLTDEQVRQAKQNLENTQKLFDQGVASSIELEKAEASYTEAQLNAEDSVNTTRLTVTSRENELTRLQNEVSNQENDVTRRKNDVTSQQNEVRRMQTKKVNQLKIIPDCGFNYILTQKFPTEERASCIFRGSFFLIYRLLFPSQ